MSKTDPTNVNIYKTSCQLLRLIIGQILEKNAKVSRVDLTLANDNFLMVPHDYA